LRESGRGRCLAIDCRALKRASRWLPWRRLRWNMSERACHLKPTPQLERAERDGSRGSRTGGRKFLPRRILASCRTRSSEPESVHRPWRGSSTRESLLHFSLPSVCIIGRTCWRTGVRHRLTFVGTSTRTCGSSTTTRTRSLPCGPGEAGTTHRLTGSPTPRCSGSTAIHSGPHSLALSSAISWSGRSPR
jgi:hypothetical protein